MGLPQAGMKMIAFNRRRFLAASSAMSIAACAALPIDRQAVIARQRIDALVASGNVPAAGLVFRRSGKIVFSHAAGLAQGVAGETTPVLFTSSTKMRVASVSKLATALTAHRLHDIGAIDLDDDVSELFERSIRHPGFPLNPVTLRQILGHTAGIEDPDIYWIAAPHPIEDLFVPDMWRESGYGPPGAGFRYSNFGYGLAATVLERLTGERFDRLAKRLVLDPAGTEAGFNWSGVARTDRGRGATLYRKIDDIWEVQADGPDVLRSDRPSILEAPDYDLRDYVPGTNGTLFSPQGGLRASLDDLCRLVRDVSRTPAMRTITWRFDANTWNGDTESGYFAAFGAGAHVHTPDDSPLPGYEIIGHHGEAYGLYCEAWHVPALDAEFAFAVTGTPDGTPPASPLHPAANIYTAPLFSAARGLFRS